MRSMGIAVPSLMRYRRADRSFSTIKQDSVLIFSMTSEGMTASTGESPSVVGIKNSLPLMIFLSVKIGDFVVPAIGYPLFSKIFLSS